MNLLNCTYIKNKIKSVAPLLEVINLSLTCLLFTSQVSRENKLNFKIWDSDGIESEGKDDKVCLSYNKIVMIFNVKINQVFYLRLR